MLWYLVFSELYTNSNEPIYRSTVNGTPETIHDFFTECNELCDYDMNT